MFMKKTPRGQNKVQGIIIVMSSQTPRGVKRVRVVSKTEDNSSSKDELQKVSKKRLKAAPTSIPTPTPAAVAKPTIVARKLSTDSPAAATLGIY